MTFLTGLTLFSVVSLAVATGLALFQYVVLPIGNGLGQVKELLDERARGRKQ